jgi:ketosteroid isomerase-like protein
MKIKVLLLSFIAAYGCNQVDTKTEEAKLMQLSRDWSKSASTDSIEKTLSYWSDDAIVMQPGQPPIKGKDAIRSMVEGASKIPGFKISWEPISASVSKSGDLAYLVEQNQITVNDSLGKPVTEFNKGITVWRKQADGSWKDVIDIWNAAPATK